MQNSYSGTEASSIVDANVLVTVDPTLLDHSMLAKLLGRVKSSFQRDDTDSTTMSANPTAALPLQKDVGLGVTGMTKNTSRQHSPVQCDMTTNPNQRLPLWLDPSFNVETFTTGPLLASHHDDDLIQTWQASDFAHNDWHE